MAKKYSGVGVGGGNRELRPTKDVSGSNVGVTRARSSSPSAVDGGTYNEKRIERGKKLGAAGGKIFQLLGVTPTAREQAAYDRSQDQAREGAEISRKEASAAKTAAVAHSRDLEKARAVARGQIMAERERGVQEQILERLKYENKISEEDYRIEKADAIARAAAKKTFYTKLAESGVDPDDVPEGLSDKAANAFMAAKNEAAALSDANAAAAHVNQREAEIIRESLDTVEGKQQVVEEDKQRKRAIGVANTLGEAQAAEKYARTVPENSAVVNLSDGRLMAQGSYETETPGGTDVLGNTIMMKTRVPASGFIPREQISAAQAAEAAAAAKAPGQSPGQTTQAPLQWSPSTPDTGNAYQQTGRATREPIGTFFTPDPTRPSVSRGPLLDRTGAQQAPVDFLSDEFIGTLLNRYPNRMTPQGATTPEEKQRALEAVKRILSVNPPQ